MYYLYNTQYHFNNFIQFLNLDSSKILSLNDLILPYNLYISSHSVFKKTVNWDGNRIINFENLSVLAPAFFKKHQHFFGSNPLSIENKILNGFFSNAINEIKQENSSMYEYVHLLMRVIVINHMNEYLEGTSYEGLGLSCIDFKNHYTKQDFKELLVHQVVHKLIFIDQLIQPQILPEYFDYVIETDFQHKRGGNIFQLYIAFHSFLVGVEILLYRQQSSTLDFDGNYHGSTASILKKSLRACPLMKKHMYAFTDHGHQILSKAFQALTEFEKTYLSIELH